MGWIESMEAKLKNDHNANMLIGCRKLLNNVDTGKFKPTPPEKRIIEVIMALVAIIDSQENIDSKEKN